ncbi:MAG TPA: protein-methionine-sulfoxide reductase heme-binding subunit MsrQ [Anaerolineae bacterium]|nr:protein-methionine-sulfoxide reductase heme-binding subunit MsrQ [Anaerolineae bacterium]
MKRLTLLRGVMHFGALLPLAILIVDAANNKLTFNPIQAATQRTGDTAIILLGLSLLCSPLSTYLKWKDAIKLRRALGLYACLYATVHVWLFVGANFGFQLNFIVPEFLQKYYLWAGLPAFAILVALAATSFRWSMRRMGKNWKRLHRYIYLAAILVVLHLAFVIKGDFFRLGGDVWKPLVAVVVIGALLIVRVPPIRRALLSLRSGARLKTRSTDPLPVRD